MYLVTVHEFNILNLSGYLNKIAQNCLLKISLNIFSDRYKYINKTTRFYLSFSQSIMKQL